MKDKKNNRDTDQYITIPIWFIERTSSKKSPFYLTPFERELYCLISGLSKKEPCYAHDGYFADRFNVTVKHVNQSISKLKSLGIIKVTDKRNKRLITAVADPDGVWVVWNENKVFVNTPNGVEEYELDEFCNLKPEE
jgi:hypothetical protein